MQGAQGGAGASELQAHQSQRVVDSLALSVSAPLHIPISPYQSHLSGNSEEGFPFSFWLCTEEMWQTHR